MNKIMKIAPILLGLTFLAACDDDKASKQDGADYSYSYQDEELYERYAQATPASKKNYDALMDKSIKVNDTTSYTFLEVLQQLESLDSQYHDLLDPYYVSIYSDKDLAAIWNSTIEYSNRDLMVLKDLNTYLITLAEDPDFAYISDDIKEINENLKNYTNIIQAFQTAAESDLSIKEMRTKLKKEEDFKKPRKALQDFQNLLNHYTAIEKEKDILENTERIRLEGSSGLDKKETTKIKENLALMQAGYTGDDELYLLENLSNLLSSYAVVAEIDLPAKVGTIPFVSMYDDGFDEETAALYLSSQKRELTEISKTLDKIEKFYKGLDSVDYTEKAVEAKKERIAFGVKAYRTLLKSTNSPLDIKEKDIVEILEQHNKNVKAYQKEESTYQKKVNEAL